MPTTPPTDFAQRSARLSVGMDNHQNRVSLRIFVLKQAMHSCFMRDDDDLTAQSIIARAICIEQHFFTALQPPPSDPPMELPHNFEFKMRHTAIELARDFINLHNKDYKIDISYFIQAATFFENYIL